MRWLKRFLLAGASLLAMGGTAHADFVVTPIAFALFAGPLGAVAGVGAIYTGVQIALAAGLSIASSLIGRQGKQKIDPGQYKNTFESSESSEVNAIGRVMLGGLKMFGNTSGHDRFRLIGHARGELVAIETHRLGGREVTVEPNGDVSSPPYAKVGGSWVNIQTKVGDGSETAWPDLVSEFPSLWTSAHRVRGIAQSLVKYVSPGIYTEQFGKLYQGGEPDLTIEARFKYSYDPRDGSQDKNDATTWSWTDNGPLCAARIMLSYPDLTVDSFDWDFIADEADRADAMVSTLTGTEKRSRCSGVWLSEADRGATMKDVVTSIGAEIVQSDAGLIRIRLVDDAPTSEIAFAEKQEIDWNWKSGPEAVERPNVCRIKYYSPERNYEMADIDLTGIAWARIDDEVTRYGEKYFDIDLPFCPSASQAQRIARREFALARADSGVLNTNMEGVAAWGATYATIAFPDLDESPLCKLAPPRIDDSAGTVEIPYVVWPTLAAWVPATDEAPAPDEIGTLENTSDLPKPDAPTRAIMVTLPSTAKQLRVGYTLPSGSGATIAEAVYRELALAGAFQSMTERGDLEGVQVATADADKTGDLCQFKVRIWDADGGSYFSEVLETTPENDDATAPDDPSIALDVAGSIVTATLTQSPSIQATYVIVSDSDTGEGTYTLAPFQTQALGQTFVNAGNTVTWHATAYNSAGVASATVTASYTAPGGP